MGYTEDEGVLSFLRNGDKNAMAITFFGTLNSLDKIQRVPSRIPISLNTHRERERKALDHHGRDKDRSPFNHDSDVRYLNNLKIWKNRPPPCNQHICPSLEERYKKHLLEKHTTTIKKQGTQCGESCIEMIKRSSVTTSTTSVALTRNIFEDGSGPSMLVLPDLDRNKSYVINQNNWYENLSDVMNYDRDEYSMAENAIESTNHNNNKDKKNSPSNNRHYGNDINNQNEMNSDTGSSNNRCYIKHDGMDYSNEANRNGASSNNRHRQSIDNDENDLNTMSTSENTNNRDIKLNKMDNKNNSKPYGGSINNRNHQNVSHDTNEQSFVPDDVIANDNLDTHGYSSRPFFASKSNNHMNLSRPLGGNNKNCDNNSIPLKRTDTREIVTPNRYIYKDLIQTEIRQWLEDVPLYLNPSEQESEIDNIVTTLTTKIINLGPRCHNSKQYEEKFKFTVDQMLSRLPMWYPGQKCDQILFKNNLTDSLYNKIEALNQNTKSNCATTYRDSYNNMNYKNNKNSQRSLSDAAEEELSSWVSAKTRILPIQFDDATVTEIMLKRLVPMLKNPVNPSTSKFNLKCAIAEILSDLTCPHCSSKVNDFKLYKMAEDLAMGLLAIQAQYEQESQCASVASQALCKSPCSQHMGCIIKREINKCLNATEFVFHDEIKNVIANIIINYLNPKVLISEVEVKNEILKELYRYCIPECSARYITRDILKEIKLALNQSNTFQTMCIPTIITKISAFASEEIFCTYPVTSTPKKKKPLKQNPEEIEYEEKVTNLIRNWMETLPGVSLDQEDVIFKETMIKDLAGEIVDLVKLEQTATIDESDNFRKHIVYRWVNKMNVYDINEIKEQIDEFVQKLKYIEVPNLTRPHCGNRQAITQQRENYENFNEFHLPKASDILEDEISIWMHNQPNVFNTDRDTRDKKIEEIANILHKKLSNKQPGEEILKDLTQWLDGIVKPENKDKIGQFAADLKNRVIKLPQDATLAINLAKKEQERAEFFEEMNNKNKVDSPLELTTTDEDTINADNTMRNFISKYIEHNYDVDDPLARGAFSHLLKARLQRLNPSKSKKVDDKLEESSTNALLPRGKLVRELDYIKDVSDWLKNIAVAPSFNTIGNRKRIDFVNDLAHNILDIEEEREAKPDAMDYDLYLASVIGQFIDHIPIENDHHNSQYMFFIIKQLITKVSAHRNMNYNTFNNDESIDTSGVNNDNIGDFIEEFILINGSDIADDELKLEAWSMRLLNEIKKMASENALTKGEVYNQLLDVPKPGDETMKQFETEIEYIKEISQWIKNLPLLPISKTEREERIKMINELTEKVTERDNMKLNDPNNTKADSEFAEYISKWIGNLSLDESREVVVAVVIQQLLNRIEKVKSNVTDTIQPPEPAGLQPPEPAGLQPPEPAGLQPQEPEDPSDNDSKKKETKKTPEKHGTKTSHPISPATAMVDAIDQWSSSLPITGKDNEVRSLKNDVSKKLYQTVGELNIDPRTFNDDFLYKNTLEDEVDAVIENLPQNAKFEGDKKQLRDGLVQSIVSAQQAIKENSAGDQYKHRLEHTIEASMPHPVKSRQGFDPGFEMYKSRLADMFILDNFDHANDDVKVQYEKTIKRELDKFYPSAKNKNIIPLTKDEIYNELYCALFKVPVPNEKSVIDEVEQIKTRCVIDMWYDKLPLKRTNDVSDLLERDKILKSLTKRVFEIERSSKTLFPISCDDKMLSEIKKWLGKLPLLPGKENNIESFAKKLVKELKSSTNQRKCTTEDPVKGKESVKSKTKGKSKDVIGKRSKPKNKAVDSLVSMVENWCLSLPIYSNRPQDAENNNILKDNLVTTIMIKLCELNMDPKIFNDDLLYDSLLDEELDNVLRDVPMSCNFEKIKEEKKQQLKDAVRSIKPIFKEEKAKHLYNKNLENTVARVLVTSEDLTPKKEAGFKSIKDDIVENFVLFTYDKDNEKSRQAHKIKIHDAVVKFCSEYKTEAKDPLMLRNKLICELTKVLAPAQDTLKEDAEEIRMKNDITKFFKEQAIDSNDDKTNQVKSSLAVKLNELELSGHNPKSEAKMKQEIQKHLKSLGPAVKPEAIDKFVNELKEDEGDRRAIPKNLIDPCLSGCTPGEICKTDFAPVHNPENKPGADNKETCLDHCQNRSSSKHRNKQTQPNVICECVRECRMSSLNNDCNCMQVYMYTSRRNKSSEHLNQNRDTIHSEDCNCKICDCAREIQKLAQGRQYLKFCPRNKDKISFCMPAGYFYF